MSIPVTEEETACTLHLQCSAAIDAAQELQAALLCAIRSGKSVRVEWGAVKEMDVTAAQLLWAAARLAKQKGVEFSFSDPVPSPVSDALRDLGLEHLPVPG